ncbi:tlp-20 [Sucra jujuba nucleopolyhedrovirus]|uniref:Tlp-20 n=1 Tax=Sucra jujuba nucleopolyhedrovirus TaxID=1563660 RepID=A0A097P933_9ABAC|nr:tlp-20 [Sucra jujuba nucleopolyhedrovirus]AIU41309.1 tlp-20 [Sucra jujuba nucleopolyhedrovirus]
MTDNSNGIVNIAVYTTLDKGEDGNNILSFIVQDEYHLKKLTIGAYNLNILPTQLLKDLRNHYCVTVSCGDYVITHNVNENGGLNVIMFNSKPLTLKRGACLFKILYREKSNKMTSLHLDTNTYEENSINKKLASDNNSNNHTTELVLNDKPSLNAEKVAESESSHHQLFVSAFGKRQSPAGEDDDESETNTEQSSSEDESDVNRKHDRNINDSSVSAKPIPHAGDMPPSKKQKYNDTEPN